MVPMNMAREPPAIARRFCGAQSAALLTQEGSSLPTPGVVVASLKSVYVAKRTVGLRHSILLICASPLVKSLSYDQCFTPGTYAAAAGWQPEL